MGVIGVTSVLCLLGVCVNLGRCRFIGSVVGVAGLFVSPDAVNIANMVSV